MKASFVETPANKPRIDKAARFRIGEFVKAVERLQEKYAVEIAVMDDAIGFQDQARTDKWNGYGDFDAYIFDCGFQPGRLRKKHLRFENFGGWGK